MADLSDKAKQVLAVFVDSSAVSAGEPLREEIVVHRGGSRTGLVDLIKAGLIDPRAHEEGGVDLYLSWGTRVCPRHTYWVVDNGERREAIIWRWPGLRPGDPPTTTVMLGEVISCTRHTYVTCGRLTIDDVPNGRSRSFAITREIH